MDEDMKPPASESTDGGDSRTASDAGSMPRLSAYYGNPKVTAAAFVREVKIAAKSARQAGVEAARFDLGDTAQVLERLDEFDPSLVRTGALLGKGPPFRGWVERATEETLNRLMGDIGNDDPTITERFRRFLNNTDGDLLGKDAGRKRRAKNLIRLVFVWMIERERLEPERALSLIWRQISRNRREPGKPPKLPTLRQMLVGAPYPQLLKFSQLAALYEEARDKAVRERDSLFSDLAHAQKQHDLQMTDLEKTRAALRRTEEAHAEITARLEKTESELRGEKELRAADRRQSVAQSRQFLLQRLSPLLADARDALDFHTPHIPGSRQRIEMAETALKKEVERLDG